MMDYPKEFLDLLDSVKSKRPKTVILHILKHGFITTEELQKNYGYKHAPRAARDVRERGIPLMTFWTEDSSGKRIAAYKFGDYSHPSHLPSKSSGRTALSKALKSMLIKEHGAKCFLTLEIMDESELQIDHRIPYEIGGEPKEFVSSDFMLLSPSSNREKSKVCEHCPNWIKKDVNFCKRCFWAYPEDYDHIAGNTGKAVVIVFSKDDMPD